MRVRAEGQGVVGDARQGIFPTLRNLSTRGPGFHPGLMPAGAYHDIDARLELDPSRKRPAYPPSGGSQLSSRLTRMGGFGQR
jgi:hypothetical protein